MDIINTLKKKLKELQENIADTKGLVQQGKFIPLENLKTNLQMIANPQTRETWLQGFFPIQTIKPVENLKSNIQAISSPQTRETFIKGFTPNISPSITQPLQRVYDFLTNKQYASSILEKIEPKNKIGSFLYKSFIYNPEEQQLFPSGFIANVNRYLKAKELAEKGKLSKKEVEEIKFKELFPSIIAFSTPIKQTSDKNLLKNVSKAVKEGKITTEEGQAILGILKEKSPQIPAKTTPPPPKIMVGESGGEAIQPQLKERKFYQTAIKSKATPKVIKEQLPKSEARFYQPVSLPERMQKASDYISKKGFDQALDDFLNNRISPEDNIAVGEALASVSFKQGRYNEGYKIIEELTKKGTEMGRGVQSFSFWSRLTPEGMLKYAEKQIKEASKKFTVDKLFGRKPKGLEEREIKMIVDYMTKAQTAANEQDKIKYTKLAMEVINEKIPWNVSEAFDTFRLNNILSNPRSHMRNIWGNAVNTLFKRPLTLLFEGRPKEAIKYEIGVLKSFPDAIDEAIKGFKMDVDDLSKLDVRTLKAKKAPLWTSFSLRGLEAEDKFFSKLVEAGELARGKSLQEAKKFADYLLYRQKIGDKNAQGYLLRFLDDTIGGLMQHMARTPVLNWFVPFARTPFNIAKTQLEYSPFGLLTIPGSADKRAQTAKAMIGSIATLIGAKLALEGRTTFAPPTDPEAKEYFYASGKRPFSVLIGNKWVPLYYFGDLSLALILPAMYKYYSEEAPTALSSGDLEKISQVTSAILYYWSQQTPLTGIGNFVDLARGNTDLTFLRNLGFTASQGIPASGLLSYVSQVLDNVYRKPKGFGEQILSQLPLLSKKVKEYYKTPTGEPATRPLSAVFLPYTLGTREEKYEPFYQERIKEIQENKKLNQLKKKIEEGQEITPEEASLTLTKTEKKQMEKEGLPLQTIIESKKLQALYDKGDKYFELYLKAPDEQTQEEIRRNITKLGLDFDEGLYNYIAKQETDVKTEFIKSVIEQAGEEADIISLLSGFRKKGIVNKKQILSNGVIDNLYDEGIITNEQRKYLKSLDYDKKTKKVIAKGRKTKKIKVSSIPKLQTVKIAFPKKKIKAVKISSGITSKQPAFKKVSVKLSPTKKKSVIQDLQERLKKITG